MNRTIAEAKVPGAPFVSNMIERLPPRSSHIDAWNRGVEACISIVESDSLQCSFSPQNYREAIAGNMKLLLR